MIYRWVVQTKYYLMRFSVRMGMPWILGRFACLGQKILEQIEHTRLVANVQKGREDYIIEAIPCPELRVRPWLVEIYLKRKDILPLLVQEQNVDWLSLPQPKCIFMDSFSELTDQLFVHRQDKWKFCCHFSDLVHDDPFDKVFESRGLIPIEMLESMYRSYFTLIRESYPDVPIIFLHFPTTLDDRVKFKLRYQAILNTITDLCNEFAPFYSIQVDEDVVDWPETHRVDKAKFPYHFGDKTHRAFVRQIEKQNALKYFI